MSLISLSLILPLSLILLISISLYIIGYWVDYAIGIHIIDCQLNIKNEN